MLTSKEFELKYDTYKDTVFRIAFTYLKNQAESEDVMQEVFLKLYTAAPDFEGEEHEKRWLIRVTVNLCKNQLKSFWRSHRGEIENLEQIADQPMDREILQEVLALPEKYKAVIYLFYVEGYKSREIAEILGEKDSTVKMRLKKGRELLRMEHRGKEVLV